MSHSPLDACDRAAHQREAMAAYYAGAETIAPFTATEPDDPPLDEERPRPSGFAEWFARAFDWFGFRLLTHYPPETDNWIARQTRRGRLTAGMNYYRANLHMIFAKAAPSATVPVYGLWSSGDSFLAEKQMIASEKFVAAPWRYSRIEGATHWMQLDAPEKVNAVLLDYLR